MLHGRVLGLELQRRQGIDAGDGVRAAVELSSRACERVCRQGSHGSRGGGLNGLGLREGQQDIGGILLDDV